MGHGELLTEDDILIATWLKKYGQITAYTVAVVSFTVFLVRFDQKSADANRSLETISSQVKVLSGKVDDLQIITHDRERYERWLKQANSRLKRLYNARGWAYEEIE